jgi:hypothetical protein
MRVSYHPEFPADVLKFEIQYREVSLQLGARFRKEVDEAIESIKLSPGSAGHFLNLGSAIARVRMRRRNLKNFPFFLLYIHIDDRLMFGAVIPNRSDPLTWLARF